MGSALSRFTEPREECTHNRALVGGVLPVVVGIEIVNEYGQMEMRGAYFDERKGVETRDVTCEVCDRKWGPWRQTQARSWLRRQRIEHWDWHSLADLEREMVVANLREIERELL